MMDPQLQSATFWLVVVIGTRLFLEDLWSTLGSIQRIRALRREARSHQLNTDAIRKAMESQKAEKS